MKILFVAAQLYLPQSYGGVQTSTHQLCRALTARGHKVALLMSLMPRGWMGFKSRIHMHINRVLGGCKVSKDSGLGYPVWRTYFPETALDYVCGKEKPDLIVIMSGCNIMPAALKALQTKIPMLVQLHDIAINEYGEDFRKLSNAPFIANSRFTAEKYREVYGISASVLHPFIVTELYRTATTRENITFINPARVKGRDIACEIARLCPDIPFTFVTGWALPPDERRQLESKLSTLSNVTLRPSMRDMRGIYGKCKVLLVPSTFQETYGRVVTEAQTSGIPVIASNRGGLPETVGPGGLVLDPEGPIEKWVEAIRKLWQDEAYYAELSAAASAYAERPEMNFERQIDAHEKALLAAAGKQK